MKQLESYTYTVPANGSVQIPAPNDNFYVTASTGPLSVRGDTFGRLRGIVAGQGLKGVPFNRLELIDESGAPNTVTILLTPAEFVNQVFSGSVGVVGAIALNTATINSLTIPMAATANYKSGAAMVTNTPETVFLPAANVNGAIIISAQASIANAGSALFDTVLIAKNAAPATILDGEIIMGTMPSAFQASSSQYCAAGQLQQAQFVPAGLGLYFISDGAVQSVAGAYRACRYRLL